MSTILVIDDNKAYREGLIELLNSEGYMTLEAENGLLGLQIIHQYLPDLILCDVDMPVMDVSSPKNMYHVKLGFSDCV